MISRLLCASLLIILAGCSKSAPEDPPAETPPATAPAKPTMGTSGSSSDASPPAKIDLNEASEKTFMTVPGVGERMAHEFDEYRPYVSILQFRREMGKYVTPAVIAEYERYVFVPVDYNECDAPTLQQIPGVDEGIAGGLLLDRPFASTDAFLAALGRHLTAAQVEVARTYLAK